MKKIISLVIGIISIVLMTFFAIPKLLGKPQSIAGFQQFEQSIDINADFFRVFTGISELFLSAFILVFLFTRNTKIGLFAYGFLLITMISALNLEFIARPEPKIMLVIIAIVLASFSIYQLVNIIKQIA